jgi:hypothetical protein
LRAGKSGDTLNTKFRQAMEFAITAKRRIFNGIGFALMTPGGRKAPGVFCLPRLENVFREGVLA